MRQVDTVGKPPKDKPRDPKLQQAIILIRSAHDLISTNDPGQRLIGELEAFLKSEGVLTREQAIAASEKHTQAILAKKRRSVDK